MSMIYFGYSAEESGEGTLATPTTASLSLTTFAPIVTAFADLIRRVTQEGAEVVVQFDNPVRRVTQEGAEVLAQHDNLNRRVTSAGAEVIMQDDNVTRRVTAVGVEVLVKIAAGRSQAFIIG